MITEDFEFKDWSHDEGMSPDLPSKTFEYFCLRCETEIYFDETEHQWCCECFATITEPDEDGMPNLAFKPEYWIGNTEGRGVAAWKELDE